MKNLAEVVAVYFPSDHRDKLYDRWYGSGWNEWRLMEQARLRDFCERRPLDRALACMNVPRPTTAEFARRHAAGVCEYPHLAQRTAFWDDVLQERRYEEYLDTFVNAARGKFGLSHLICINHLNLAFEVLGDTRRRVGNLPLSCPVEFDAFCHALEAPRLPGGVLYPAQHVPDVSTANCWMERVRNYRAVMPCA